MSQRIIASWIRDTDEENFAHFFQPHPDMRVVNARTEAVDLDAMDGLLLTGGPDIHQDFLRQPVEDPSVIQDAVPERDAWEFAALEKALAKELPILAVCKGHQVLNVGLGGTLLLDIKGHNLPEQKLSNCQPLRYVANPTISFPIVNSSHHQAIDKLGDGLTVEAWHTEDNIIEQVRLQNYPFAVGVQFHPERHPSYYPLFDLFAEHVRQAR